MCRDRYLHAVAANGQLIAEAVAVAPATAVPSCPDWRLRDLGLHVATVMNMWAENVRRASTDPPPYGIDPPEDEDLGQLVRAEVDGLLEALADLADDSPAWNWWGDPTARGIPRRAAHETAVHAWDATNALGAPTALDPYLSGDGVAEFFDVMMPFTGQAPEGLTGTLQLEATDTDAAWLVVLDRNRLPTARTGRLGGDATLRAPASDLLLVLWRRLQPASVEITGDRTLVERFLAYPRLG